VSDTTVLNRMIKDTAKISLLEHYNGKKKVVLIERGTTGSELEIHNIPHDAVVIDVDSSFENANLFASNASECKRSNYIIVSESKKVALFIEMKKGNPDTAGIIKQLKGGLCVFEYCQSIAREFFSENNFLSEYKKRFVVFKQVNLIKKKTAIDKTVIGSHSSPDNLLKVSWAKTIQFGKISG